MKHLPAKPRATLASAVVFLSQLAAHAHPGHYHPPGEEDEFDALRADWLHLHGGLEICLLAVLVLSPLVFWMSRRRSIRLGAAFVFFASVATIALS